MLGQGTSSFVSLYVMGTNVKLYMKKNFLLTDTIVGEPDTEGGSGGDTSADEGDRRGHYFLV